jgi:hypothetical protein
MARELSAALLAALVAQSLSCAGACVRSSPDESRVPALDGDGTNPRADGVFSVSNVESTSEAACSPFKTWVSAYGLMLLADSEGQTVPEANLKWIARAVTEIFPYAKRGTMQNKVVQSMYRYRAALPVFHGQLDYRAMEQNDGAFEFCDTITVAMVDGGRPIAPTDQTKEVVEHILHAVTNVGLAQAFPSQWGISTSSDLYAAMMEARAAGAYDDSSYDGIGEPDARLRIRLQEFAYWALCASWGLFEGPNSIRNDVRPGEEWALSSPAEVQTNLPLFWALHQATTAQILDKPSDETLGRIGESAPTAPAWPIIDAGRGDLTAYARSMDAPSRGCSGVESEAGLVCLPWDDAVCLSAAEAGAAAAAAVVVALCLVCALRRLCRRGGKGTGGSGAAGGDPSGRIDGLEMGLGGGRRGAREATATAQ